MPRTPSDKPFKAATIADVATLAGVSRSAVSRAYTPGASVSATMRSKIAEAALALGYRPNLIARSLSTQRSNTVALAMTRLDNPFHAHLLQHLARGLQARGYQVLLFVADPTTEDNPPIEELLRHRVAAIILSAVQISSHYAHECRAAGVPVLMVNRLAEGGDAVTTIVGDNEAGGALVAELFARAGHTRPVFIAGTPESSTSIFRGKGFHDALARSGVSALPVEDAGYDNMQNTTEVMRRLLSSANPPDAVFCANDQMAIAALQVARHEFGLAVGETLSIVGYDDASTSALPDIGLTTVAQPIGEFADATLHELDAMMRDGDRQPTNRIIPARLIERSSSRKSG